MRTSPTIAASLSTPPVLMKLPQITLALACSLSLCVQARTVAGIELPAPWPAGEVHDTHWGTRVPDPYRELENVGDERVQAWLRAHADSTTKILARIPGRAALLARIQALDAEASGVVSRITRTDDGRLFFLRRDPSEQQFRLVLRESVNADPAQDRVLVDPDALSKAAGKPVAIMDYAPSPDGKKLAYSLQSGGGEIGSLQVIDVASGRVLAGPIDRIRYSGATWLPDSSALFYARLREGFAQLPATERFQDRRTHLLTLDGDDRVVFSASRHPELALPPIANAHIAQVPGRPLVAARIALGVERNAVLLLADLEQLKQGRAQWRKVVDVSDQVSEFEFGDGVIYLRSAKGAPRFQVLRLRLDAPEMARAEVLVPQGEGVITAMSGARDALYLTQRDGVTTSLWRLPVGSSQPQRIELPVSGRVGVRHVDPRQDGVLLQLGGWTRASADYRYDAAGGRITPLPLARAGAFDAPAGIVAREALVKSHDGVQVPVSILSRSDVKLDGRNPTLLYGYGAYGTVESPALNPRLLAWLERGGVYVFAHVRGGGVYGREWHEAGRKTTKPNTWRDGIAVAEWLIANGYSSSDRLAIYGGSAGGIFVGRAITERPDLFAAGVSSVGVLDTVRSETRANGVANVPEYGTVTREDEFRGLLAMSSYHALRPGTSYPAVLLTHGVNDIRVDVWQSAKFAARLAAVNTGERATLMRLEYEAGHGQGSSRAQSQERIADVWAFLLWQFGVEGFQPSSVPLK